jgi:precorrin-2/cobalt-factor-2 C20-methyltransferase
MSAATLERAGVLFGVGLGPGDPELVTMKAARILRETLIVAYYAKAGRESHARRIGARYFAAGCEEMLLAYPMTTERPFHHPEYVAALSRFYEESAQRIGDRLREGRNVALICEGDPMLYGSFMHMFIRLREEFRVEICAGVSGMSGCFAAARLPMTWGDDVLTVIPATLPEATLIERLRATDAATVMKLGGNLAKLRRALIAVNMLDRAVYVERGTMAEQKIVPLRDKTDDSAPYFSMVLAPGEGRRP